MVAMDVSKLPAQDAYRLLIGAIVPRPIAWVSTLSAAGITNLAPFSFFNGICSNPPAVLFCPVTPADREAKDPLRNIRETHQFVVNIVTESNVAQANQTSAPIRRMSANSRLLA